jgi:hypothetical protein
MCSSFAPRKDGTGCRGGVFGSRARRTLGVLLCVGMPAGSAWAQSVSLADEFAPARASEGASLIERATHLGAAEPAPTFTLERTRWPAGAPSSVVALDAAGRPLADAAGFSYRWWLRRGRADVGIGLGAIGRVVAPVEASGEATLAYAASTLTLGLRYQLTERSTLYADASGARRGQGEAGADLFATKLGVEWAGRSRSRLGFDKGAFGLLLDSGYRMSLRIRHGGLGIYVRGQF